MTGRWWLIALRGVAALGFGVVALMWPEITVVALVLVFAGYAAFDGLFALASAVESRHPRRSWDWNLVLEGAVGVGAAIVAVTWPRITALALVYVIAAWALLTGLIEVAAAIRLRRQIEREWLLAVTGLASLALGVLFMVRPLAGAVSIALLFGAYAVVVGVVLLVLAFRLRRWGRGSDQRGRAPVGSTPRAGYPPSSGAFGSR